MSATTASRSPGRNTNTFPTGRHHAGSFPSEAAWSAMAQSSWSRKTFSVVLNTGSLQGARRNLSDFSEAELATIDAVLDDLAGMTGTQVSTLSHEVPAWRHTEAGETIPYELALVPKEQVLTPTAQRVGAEVAARYQLADAG